jgi:SNF2 family DNA or RNA helicase
MLNSKTFTLTRSQADYINKNYIGKPKVVRLWMEIDDYLAKEYMSTKFLQSPPKSIWIEKLLSETEKAYHVWGRVIESDSLNAFWVPKNQIIPRAAPDVAVDFDEFSHRPPFEHQKTAIIKLASNKKYILADDMGLGKTSSAIMASISCKVKKVLIICPASLKVNWKREIENYTDEPVGIVEGKKWVGGKYVIINYDILKNFHSLPKDKDKKKQIIDSKFDLVIIDEAHYVSNGKAQRTKLVNN